MTYFRGTIYRINKASFDLQEKFKPLTGIRAVAAIMVFLYHNRKYWRDHLSEWVMQNLNEFHVGVTLFFVLSGFLIAYTYQEKPLVSKRSYLQYLFIRLFRIFPVYILLITINYIDFGFPETNKIIFNYTLLKGFSDVYNLDALPQSWTLTVELCFYFLAPFIYWQTKKSIPLTIFYLMGLMALCIGIGYYWRYVNGNPYRWFYDWKFILNGTFFGRFMEFYIGVLLALYFKKQKELSTTISIKHLTSISLALIFVLIYAISCFETNIYDHGTSHLPGILIRNVVLPITVALFLLGLITERTLLSRALSTRLAILLGNASYAFYLVHYGYVNRRLISFHLFPDRNFIVLWLLAILIYWAIEKPVYEWARTMIKKLF
jgi:peptidoglycan/LPS O-acetylase OafA/YrhL